MSLTDTSSNTIISVVDQFDYSTQDPTYNESFIRWRKNKDNPYAFNFEINRKESVFVDGKGFESKSASAVERDCIAKIMNTAGIAMLIWILTENIISKLVIVVFDALGFDLHTSFFSTALYGGSGEIITALTLISFFKIFVPAIYIHKKLKMPRRLEYMSTLNAPVDMLSTFFVTLAVSTVTGLPNIYTNRTQQVFDFFRSINADIMVWDQEQFLFYTLFDIIILSLLSELFFRGAVFCALRQFGDLFAIIITSAMSGFLVQDFRELPAAVMISMVASVGMLRSGTIFTAVFVQVLFKMYRLTLVILEDGSPDTMFPKRNYFMLIVFAVSAAGFILLHMLRRKKNKHYFASYTSEFSMKQRLTISCKSFPMPAVLCICLLSAVIRLFF